MKIGNTTCARPRPFLRKALAGLALLSLARYEAAAAAGPFVEQDGIVHFGVEQAQAVSGWNPGTSIGGYIGKSYYTAAKGSDNGGSGTLSYTFQIKNAGKYQILVRNRITGGNSTEANDSFLSASGSPIPGQWTIGTNQWYKIYCNKASQWTWETSTKDHDAKGIRQQFSAGTHTVKLSLRSAGHILDHILIYDYVKYPDFAAATGKQPQTDRLDAIAKGETSAVIRMPAARGSRVNAHGWMPLFNRPEGLFRIDGKSGQAQGDRQACCLP